MNISRLEKFASLTGVITVILLAIGVVLMGTFDYFPTPERALEIFNKNPARVQRGALLAGFHAVIFLLWFAGSVFSALSDREGGKGRLAVIAFGGGVVCAIGMAAGSGIIWGAAALAASPVNLTPEGAVILYNLGLVMQANVLSIGLAAFIGATGISSLRTQLFPAWFSWISVMFAVGLLTPFHYIFEGLAMLWIVVVSIILFLR